MERVLSIVRAVALFAVLLACMLSGIFAATGLCALVYGPSILDTALGKPPDRTHPAFWLFMIVSVPGMLIGAAGALFAIMLPVAARWKVGGFPSPRDHRLLTRYLSFVGSALTAERSDTGQDNHWLCLGDRDARTARATRRDQGTTGR